MKILSVDDSIIVRSMVKRALMELDTVSVIETAASGYIAQEKLKEQQFDLILCDVNMPEMTGIEFLESLNQNKIQTPVVFFTSMSVHSIEGALKALNLGALDIIAKPEGIAEDQVLNYIRDKITPFFGLKTQKNSVPAANVLKNAKVRDRVTGIVIGASTGGPKAIEQLLVKLQKIEIPIFVSVHMPDQFITQFAERLNKVVNFNVKVASDNELVCGGYCYLSHGGKSLYLERRGLQVYTMYSNIPGPGSIFPSVNELFCSASAVYDKNLIAVILSGMGEDGLQGAKAVKHEKGTVLIQDKKSCSVFGMPGAVYESGLADGIYTIESFGEALFHLTQKGSL